MDLRVQKRTAELLYYLLTQKNEEAARIPFTPGKLLLAQEMPQGKPDYFAASVGDNRPAPSYDDQRGCL